MFNNVLSCVLLCYLRSFFSIVLFDIFLKIYRFIKFYSLKSHQNPRILIEFTLSLYKLRIKFINYDYFLFFILNKSIMIINNWLKSLIFGNKL